MVEILAKIFIKKDEEDNKKRGAYGMLCGALGIALNILLFILKFIAGTVSGSIAITADAFNNLSDAGSSLISLVGFKLAGAKPDREHPFGHGRIEYISGMIISLAILLMSYELGRSSIDNIINPNETVMTTLSFLILIVSIAVKLYMYLYNRKIGDKIKSASMKATATDSLSDATSTTVVLICSLIMKFTNVNIDGYCGIAVSLFILYSGISALRDTIGPLLGQPPEPEFVSKIYTIVLEHKEITGIHDLVVHNYGPGRLMITLHGEVPSDGDINVLHDAIDLAERELRDKLGCEAVIHMDPISTDGVTEELKGDVLKIITSINPGFTLHDFRIVAGPTHTNLIFDTVIPSDIKGTDEEIKKKIYTQVRACLGKQYFCVITIDRSYT